MPGPQLGELLGKGKASLEKVCHFKVSKALSSAPSSLYLWIKVAKSYSYSIMPICFLPG